MKEKFYRWKDATITFWAGRTKMQKGFLIGGFILILIFIIGAVLLTSNPKYTTLYSNLSLQEANQIKSELDAKGVPYELSNGGTTISVPESEGDALLVELAGQGIPNSGQIDYSFFSENSSWGITDNEFNMIKVDAMQTELANLMKSIDGINDAQVMINIPKEPVFASESSGESSVSIVLNTQPGYQFQGNQINALYHLVSQAIPNLPQENIVIMNQYFEYFDSHSQTQYTTQDVHSYQRQVKKDVERDIQRRLQQMLGKMIGMDNVIVSVTADIDFTQENRTEELVEPVDVEAMEGLPLSIESIQESYSGGDFEGGVAGTGGEDITGYQGLEEDENGEYELDKETINYEFNRIRREIVESPYKIRDLGIQVAVDNVRDSNGEVEYLSQPEQMEVEEGISSIISSILSTSINEEYGEFEPEDKISIVFQEFNGASEQASTEQSMIPTWLYIVAAILLIIIIFLIILLVRNRKTKEDELEEDVFVAETNTEIPELEKDDESETVIRRKQLENLAKENPEDFAKLLRSWIGED